MTLVPRIPAAERVRFFHALVGFMCAAAAAIVARTMGTTVFLEVYRAEDLAKLYLGTALLVTFSSILVSRFLRRYSVDRLILGAAATVVAASVVVRVGLALDIAEFRIAAYFLGDWIAKSLVPLFWILAARIFNAREGKRLFGYLGAGGTLACLLAGQIVAPFTEVFGVSNLLLLAALLIAGFGFAIWRYRTEEPQAARLLGSRRRRARNPARPAYYFGLLKTGLVRNLCLLVIVTTFALYVTDFVFMGAAGGRYPGDALAPFLGQFYASSNLVALALQLFLAGWILRRGGVQVALLALPVGLLVASLGSAFTGPGGFAWIYLAKFLEPVLFFTLNHAAIQILFLGVPKQSRNQVQILVDGFFRQLAVAATGSALLLFGFPVGSRLLPALVAGAAVIWVFLAALSSRAYIAVLMDTLSARRLDFSEELTELQDQALGRRLRQRLTSADDQDVPYLVELLREVDSPISDEDLSRLLERESAAVKVAALDYSRHHARKRDVPPILVASESSDREVRLAAIRALAAIGNEDSLNRIERALDDEDPSVRGVAAAELINIGELDGLLAGTNFLKRELQSESAEARVQGARALQHLKHAQVSRALRGLLGDENRTVQAAALEALVRHPSPELVPRVIPFLAERELRSQAAKALVATGPAAIDSIRAFFESSRDLPGATVHEKLLPILGRIGSPQALPLLEKEMASDELQRRREAVAAYAQIVSQLPLTKRQRRAISAMAESELESAIESRERIDGLGGLAGTEVLTAALEDEYRAHLTNTFTLLAVCYPTVNMIRVYRSLRDGLGDRKAAALEVLDSLVEGTLEEKIIGLLETRSANLAAAEPAALDRLMERETLSDWVLAGLLYAIAENGRVELRERVGRHLAHPSAYVRETALYSLSRLGDRDALERATTQLTGDGSALVRRQALAVRQALEAGGH